MSNGGPGEPLQDDVDRLRAEVAKIGRSRKRLVEAADADRREIERALHDGVQQDLVALAVDVQRLAGLVDNDPGAARALPGRDGGSNVREALDETAELAQMVYPPAARRARLGQRLEVCGGERWRHGPGRCSGGSRRTAADHAAVYWSCVEALSSASPGSQATISVLEADGGLTFEVAVAGQHPGERPDRLRDRIEALDGRLSVEDGQDGGSRVHGWLPSSR